MKGGRWAHLGMLPALWLLSAPVEVEGASVAAADVVLHPDAVHVSRQFIQQWGERIREQGWRRYECAPLAEFPGTVLCLFAHSTVMNHIFGGAAHAIEAPRGISRRSALLGIDLRFDDLVAYRGRRYPEGDAGGGNAVSDSPEGLERAFLFDVLPQMSDRLQARAVVAAAWGNLPTIAHELRHARYFSDAGYRAAVAAFWNTRLSDAERSEISRVLGGLYDGSNEDLIINEFQAYALGGTASPWACDLNQKYRALLQTFLWEWGLEPSPAVEDESNWGQGACVLAG